MSILKSISNFFFGHPQQIIVYEERKQYKDKKGYMRFVDDKKLVHRDVAYWNIYRVMSQDEYPLRFRQYVVHHKNMKRTDNRVENLQIMTQEQHKRKHNLK